MAIQKYEINKIVPLAYNMADCSNKYVLFIGAGVSKDAGVPSGWDILLDVLKIVRQSEENISKKYSTDEMEKYYRDKCANVGYDEIIGSVFPSNEEQKEYLNDKFKDISPGESHRLIAEFVKNSLIKHIISTNHDCLLEAALDEAGLKGRYCVISTNEDIINSKPWHKEEICRIYKINGTIEKGKIRTTTKDLIAPLPKRLAKDFSSIIEANGLLILGYAANEYDGTIIKLLKKRIFKGYTLYWTQYKKEEISASRKQIINDQEGIIIPIEGAKEFLQELRDRILIAQEGTEQSQERIVSKRFEATLQSPNNGMKISQLIETEQNKLIRYAEKIIIDNINSGHTVLWKAFVELFEYSFGYIVLIDQISKYNQDHWAHITKIFEKIHLLNEDGNRHGTNGIVNYFFYVLLEITGAILLENNKFILMDALLKTRRLSKNKKYMEPILDWEIHADFIEAKNEQEAKEQNKVKYIVPNYHYLLELIQAENFPLKFDNRNRLIETDLLYFVYTIKYPFGREYGFNYWFPRSPIYTKTSAPDIFRKIRLDSELRERVANDLFRIKGAELLSILAKGKEIFHQVLPNYYVGSSGAINCLDEF